MTERSEPLARVVTVSAVYGAGGSIVAPQLAERLGMSFFDRLVHTTGPHDSAAISEQLTAEENVQAPAGRFSTRLAQLTSGLGLPMLAPDDMDPSRLLRQQVVDSVWRIAGGEGGVILGRAAAVITSSHPLAFHVRLTGPPERCLLQGMRIVGDTIESAREHQATTDRTWSRFVTRLFDRDPADPKLYHVVLDSTAIPLDRCVDLLAEAAHAFWSNAGTDPNRQP
jgi:cytidylate kinase